MFCKYSICPPHNPGEPPPQACSGYLPLTYSLNLDILVCKLGIQSAARRVYMKGLPAALPLPETRKHRLPVHWRAEPKLYPQDAETTYFCNTCGQPLCARCRDETHRARMFARHDIVALGQRSRDVLQKCSECGVRGRGRRQAGMGEGAGRRPHRRPRRSAALRALCPVLHRQEVAAVHPLLPGHAGVGRGRRRWAGERPGAGLTRGVPAGRAASTAWTSSQLTSRAASGCSRRCW